MSTEIWRLRLPRFDVDLSRVFKEQRYPDLWLAFQDRFPWPSDPREQYRRSQDIRAKFEPYPEYAFRESWSSGRQLGEVYKLRVTNAIREQNGDLATAFAGKLCDHCRGFPISRVLRSSNGDHGSSTKEFPSNGRVGHCKLCPIIFQSIGLEIPSNISTIVAEITGLKGQYTILPKAGSTLQFLLIDKWLRDCDSGHSHRKHFLSPLPTRVLDIGDSWDPIVLRLRMTDELEFGKYVALSHRWGEGDKEFLTLESNIDDRCKSIEFDMLPKTFQDAIIVTRMLGLRFIWIDSICIVQDSRSDVVFECSRMEAVFASAYVTVAATSAKSCRDGFLSRLDEVPFRLPGINGDTSLCVSKAKTDFSRDVVDGNLNQRGWVFQERALSRRTIHFTATQTYWECESAIRCEIDDQIIGELDPLSSSNFPSSLSFSKTRPSAFQYCFTKYSKLDLTCPEDKPSAILGLEYRLAVFYRTPSMFGILGDFFGESLLWKSDGNTMEPIKPIYMDPVGPRQVAVPSWSWMAYTGAISYLRVEEMSLEVTFTYADRPGSESGKRCVLNGRLGEIARDSPIHRSKDTYYEARDGPELCNWTMIRDEAGLVGLVSFDKGEEIYCERLECISIGQATGCWKDFGITLLDTELQRKFDYILLVTPAEEEWLSGLYKRLGVGVIQDGYLKRKENILVI
jgi:hypothetical protein